MDVKPEIFERDKAVEKVFRPRMVLAHSDFVYAALSCRHFRRLGWEVHLVATGREARGMVQQLAPLVVVLGTELRDESGWLTCNKLVQEKPGQKVVLVTSELSEDSRLFATFVGAAALVCQADGVQTLVNEVLGTALPATG